MKANTFKAKTIFVLLMFITLIIVSGCKLPNPTSPTPTRVKATETSPEMVYTVLRDTGAFTRYGDLKDIIPVGTEVLPAAAPWLECQLLDIEGAEQSMCLVTAVGSGVKSFVVESDITSRLK